MVKIIRDLWDQNWEKLKEKIEHLEDVNEVTYGTLAKLTYATLFDGSDIDIDSEQIHVIDDGEYQGSLIFVIPFDEYQPGPGDYLMAHCSYGSCPCCDALQGIQYEENRKQQNEDLLSLCRGIFVSTIRPYNLGWRHDSNWDEVEECTTA